MSSASDLPHHGAMFDCRNRGTSPSVVLADRELSAAAVRDTLDDAAPGIVRFSRCELSEVDLRDVNLSGTIFDHCTLADAVLGGAELDGVHAEGGDWARVNLAQSDLTDATLRNVDLSGAVLRGALLTDASFDACRMLGAALTGLRGLAVSFRLDGCNLQLADLQDLHLRGLRVHDADLSEADLRGSDLREAVLSNCRLRGIELSETRLDGADLRGSDLGELTADSPRHLAGAVISGDQASQLCAALGVVVAD